MRCLKTFVLAVLVLIVQSTAAVAGPKLEGSMSLAPSFVHDTGFAALSDQTMRMPGVSWEARWTLQFLDKRVDVAPLLGYRYGAAGGVPYSFLNTSINCHELTLGARGRYWIRPWLSGFVQLEGGFQFVRIQMELDTEEMSPTYTGYKASENGWTMGGMVGAEFKLSEKWLAKRSINRFNFGGYLGFNYQRSKDYKIKPTPTGGDEHSLPIVAAEDFGRLNLSGWGFEIGATVHFR